MRCYEAEEKGAGAAGQQAAAVMVVMGRGRWAVCPPLPPCCHPRLRMQEGEEGSDSGEEGQAAEELHPHPGGRTRSALFVSKEEGDGESAAGQEAPAGSLAPLQQAIQLCCLNALINF